MPYISTECAEVASEETEEQSLARLRRELETLLRRSTESIDRVAEKALKLRHSVRQRPSSVREMQAVLLDTSLKKDG